MKKIRLPSELSWICGMLLMPFAVSLTIKANLGMSMIAAPTYIISEKIPLTNGQVEWIMQAFFLALMCIIVRKFRVAYLSSFASAFVYGLLLDLDIYLTGFFTAENIALRIFLFLFGMTFTAVAVAMFFNTYLAPCAYDYFVRLIVNEKHLDMRRFKLSYDFSMLIFSVALTLILFRKFVGVNFGTIIMAICNGNIIAFTSKFIQKHVDFYDALPLRKFFETDKKEDKKEEKVPEE